MENEDLTAAIAVLIVLTIIWLWGLPRGGGWIQ